MSVFSSWRALGTFVHVLVADAAALAPATDRVRSVLDAVDRAYSRFRADSELSRVNARAGERIAMTPLFADAVEAALRAAETSGGAVDPTVGRAMRVVGYDDDFARIVLKSGPLTLRVEAVPGWRTIRFDRHARTIVVPRGVELDLGSSGKAFAADVAAGAAHRATKSAVLVSLGGDIATAGDAPEGGWPVLVAEDSAASADDDGEVIAIRDGAIATSSTTVRRWTRDGAVLHHIIDPETGLPASGRWRTATVVAATCVDANTAATAAIVLGEKALAWLRATGLPARLIDRDGAITRVNAWPKPIRAAVAAG